MLGSLNVGFKNLAETINDVDPAIHADGTVFADFLWRNCLGKTPLVGRFRRSETHSLLIFDSRLFQGSHPKSVSFKHWIANQDGNLLQLQKEPRAAGTLTPNEGAYFLPHETSCGRSLKRYQARSSQDWHTCKITTGNFLAFFGWCCYLTSLICFQIEKM
mmetsp:Transcript_4388/g.6993  ORF Transcript_4388/g.6993 Transcript_4388/m.6993 type:complete len:160 (+) Transcript_4388:1534-2013(+)